MKNRYPFCVYTHSHEGKIFYVGCGSEKRAHSLWPTSRGPLWRKKRAEIGSDIEVTIVAVLDDRDEALALETELIRLHQPECCINSQGRVSARDSQVRTLRGQGLTLQAIGDQLGLTRQRVWQILAGDSHVIESRAFYRRNRAAKNSVLLEKAA